jgi:hypothetical protein
MPTIRSIASMTVAVAMGFGQLTAFTASASAQGWPGHPPKQGVAAPAARPAPPVAMRAPAPAYVAPPVRYAAPAPAPRPAPRAYVAERREHHRYGHDRYGHGDRVAAGIAAGIGAIIIGSAISSSHASNRNALYERCAARFEDFDWNDGTILNEDGDRVVCPYLD